MAPSTCPRRSRNPPPSQRSTLTEAPPTAPSLFDRLTGRARPADADRAVVVLHDVTKRYPNGNEALKDVDLVVPEGDFVFLVGPSGAGKSTLMKLLIRDELATQGDVVIDGADLARIPPPPGAQGPAQDRDRVPGLQAAAAQDGLRERRVRARGHRARRGAGSGRRWTGCSPLVGLTGQAQQLPDQLSGGEQQRTAIARALVHDPRIIIADEPTGNLDPVISWEIIQLLLRINELGVTVLMATHNAEVVTALRKRVVALEDGRIIRDETGAAYHRED